MVAGATLILSPQAPAAEAASASPPTKSSSLEAFIKDSKNPTSWLSWGADFRVRNEYFNNILSLTDSAARHEQDYFRFRGRLWASVKPVKDLSINARFSDEAREWMKPSYAGQYDYRSGFEERYGILDNANVKWNNAFNQPLTITAGRQDILLGDFYNWWLVADGTPGDGSWTFFLDSIRLNYDAKDIKTKFDVIYIHQNALPDEWIPTLGRSGENLPKPYYLTEQNEQGVILYGSNKSLKNTQLDGYFIYKRDSRIRTLGNGDDANIYTVGGKVTGTFADHWNYSAEGAYQFGDKTDPTLTHDASGIGNVKRDIGAFGVNAKLGYQFKDKLNNQPYLFYEFLSGDDPSTTGKDEMFDVLWGRWPRFSELYIYSYIYETSGKVAQLNNIHRIGAGWSLNPIKNMSLLVNYSALLANQKVPTRTH